VSGYEASAWFGVGAPRNTPVEIIDLLNRQINAALKEPKITARLAELGGGSPKGDCQPLFGECFAGDTRDSAQRRAVSSRHCAGLDSPRYPDCTGWRMDAGPSLRHSPPGRIDRASLHQAPSLVRTSRNSTVGDAVRFDPYHLGSGLYATSLMTFVASPRWRYRPQVRASGLWNQRHVDETYEPLFLEYFKGMIERREKV
jgi:hypothetical protein